MAPRPRDSIPISQQPPAAAAAVPPSQCVRVIACVLRCPITRPGPATGPPRAPVLRSPSNTAEAQTRVLSHTHIRFGITLTRFFAGVPYPPPLLLCRAALACVAPFVVSGTSSLLVPVGPPPLLRAVCACVCVRAFARSGIHTKQKRKKKKTSRARASSSSCVCVRVCVFVVA